MAKTTFVEGTDEKSTIILQAALEKGRLEAKRGDQWVGIHCQSPIAKQISAGGKVTGPFRVTFPEAEPESELVQLKDLSAEQLKKVVDALARGECETYSEQAKSFILTTSEFPRLDLVYRAKPRTLDVPWSVISKEANALFISPDGKVFLTSAPDVTWDEVNKIWDIPVMHRASLQPLLSFDVTDIEQANRKSLRPKE